MPCRREAVTFLPAIFSYSECKKVHKSHKSWKDLLISTRSEENYLRKNRRDKDFFDEKDEGVRTSLFFNERRKMIENGRKQRHFARKRKRRQGIFQQKNKKGKRLFRRNKGPGTFRTKKMRGQELFRGHKKTLQPELVQTRVFLI